MPYRTRFATDKDFPQWWEVRKEALRDHPDAFGSAFADAEATPDEIARERFVSSSIAGDHVVVLAIDDDERIGGIAGLYRNTGPKTSHTVGIWGVYVRPEARGLGAGDSLIAALVEHARSLPGVLQIDLSVSSHNRSAVRLYERHGFIRWGIRPRALLLDGTPIDEDEMTLMLDAPAHPARPKGTE